MLMNSSQWLAAFAAPEFQSIKSHRHRTQQRPAVHEQRFRHRSKFLRYVNPYRGLLMPIRCQSTSAQANVSKSPIDELASPLFTNKHNQGRSSNKQDQTDKQSSSSYFDRGFRQLSPVPALPHIWKWDPQIVTQHRYPQAKWFSGRISLR